jgi:hypothetical protein
MCTIDVLSIYKFQGRSWRIPLCVLPLFWSTTQAPERKAAFTRSSWDEVGKLAPWNETLTAATIATKQIVKRLHLMPKVFADRYYQKTQ